VFDSVAITSSHLLRTAFLAALTVAAFRNLVALEGESRHHWQHPVVKLKGEYGGDLRRLSSSYTQPLQGESNHYFDLWEPGSLPTLARVQGLTNNRALFIDSHGSERLSWKGAQYVFRPRDAHGKTEHLSSFSIRDVSNVMGSHASAQIHNVIVSGCNLGGSLKAADVRRCFPQATNVTYMAAGKLAYKPIFYQFLTEHSRDIRPLYGQVFEHEGTTRADITRQPVRGAEPLGIYVADLFVPGTISAFRRQTAGRELLDPSFRPSDPFTANP
jgi:hypothetical protein